MHVPSIAPLWEPRRQINPAAGPLKQVLRRIRGGRDGPERLDQDNRAGRRWPESYDCGKKGLFTPIGLYPHEQDAEAKYYDKNPRVIGVRFVWPNKYQKIA